MNVLASCSFFMLYIMAVVFLRNESEHYDAEMAVVTMILILSVMEAVIAVNALRISCSSDSPRQVKRNVFIDFLVMYKLLHPRERVCKSTFRALHYKLLHPRECYFYLFAYFHHKFLA